MQTKRVTPGEPAGDRTKRARVLERAGERPSEIAPCRFGPRGPSAHQRQQLWRLTAPDLLATGVGDERKVEPCRERRVGALGDRARSEPVAEIALDAVAGALADGLAVERQEADCGRHEPDQMAIVDGRQ
jgi:hypothetical protein